MGDELITRFSENLTTEAVNNTGTWLTNSTLNATTAVPATPQPHITSYWQYQWYSHLFHYVPPILISTGTIGNCLTLIVLQREAFKRNPSSVVLSALALADTGMLITGFLRHWLNMITDFDVRYLSDPSCKIHYFFTYLLKHISSNFLMLLTIERTISVTFPLKCKELCSRKRMILAVVVVTLVNVAFNMHGFITMKLHTDPASNQSYCFNTEETEVFHRGAWYWIDSTLTSFLPFSVIFVGNIIIITKIVASQRMRADKMQVKASGDKTTSTTVMLVAVSINFLFLTLPFCIYFIGLGNKTWPQKTDYDWAKIAFAYAVCSILYYTNNAINFFLYCLTGTKFRRELMNIFCGRCTKAPVHTFNSSMTDVTKLDDMSQTKCTDASRF